MESVSSKASHIYECQQLLLWGRMVWVPNETMHTEFQDGSYHTI